MRITKYKDNVQQSVEYLKKWHGSAPEIAIVLGSGLSDAIPKIQEMKSVRFEEIPGFKTSTVQGHSGDLRIGSVTAYLTSGKEKTREIAFLRGRNHAYEGNDPGEVVHNLRSLITWGVKGIILTNAAGCLNTEWELGKMMILTDHINATGLSPLNGDYGLGFGAQFVDMSEGYDKKWQSQIKEIAHLSNHTIYDGVYYGVLGAHYETPAEIRMFKTLGASAVGMSTVLETIAARQLGAKVAALSCLTNYGAGLKQAQLSHTEVMDMGKRFASDMANIVLKAAVSLEV
ncbi:purine-nucleoside phosphorylase [Pigmentibacter sp. JX0631]|uniref:purine-nucleoside phosphorylase n=1 Tax=Pigmentibacter sp. JX0631 TaxID=2976982 RepID=UPI0024692BB9|nr:purine-nucleoside phosphorylase [Pigmentibacter sp. JX0631]WGL60257.1 purine-nucleoside phosphorylase [Pigmentibacter sp. JX0631]